MSVRPVLLKDIRRTAISNHQQQKGTGNYNSFSPLVDRGRSPSVGKRKLSPDKDTGSGSISQTNVTKMPRFDSSVVFEQLKGQEVIFSEVKGILGSLPGKGVFDETVPGPVKDSLRSHENLTSVLVDAFNDKLAPPPSGATGTKPKDNPAKPHKAPAPIDPDVAAARKVKLAIRDAEKKTLLFNLDLGRVPTMNKESLSTKVTLALSSKASSGKHDYDIKDAEDTIDDVLSCSKLEFLGTASRKFFNKKNPADPRNETFCTVPVKFEFKDKDTRIQAEKSLRKICKVSCAVPYPKKLREILDRLLKEGKKKCPESYIRTRVNVDSLTIDVHAKTETGWLDLELGCAIPLNICDNVNLPLPSGSQVTDPSTEVMQVS
jgi:hypothetical protein